MMIIYANFLNLVSMLVMTDGASALCHFGATRGRIKGERFKLKALEHHAARAGGSNNG